MAVQPMFARARGADVRRLRSVALVRLRQVRQSVFSPPVFFLRANPGYFTGFHPSWISKCYLRRFALRSARVCLKQEGRAAKAGRICMSSSPIPTPLPSRPEHAQSKRIASFVRRVRTLLSLRRLYLLRLELRFAPTEAQRLFALTVGIGAVCGFAAVAFHKSIHWLESHLIDRAMSAQGNAWMLWTIAVPTLGGLVCGLALEYVVPNARGSGIPQVKVAFTRSTEIRLRDALGKFFVGALQIGSGGSLGREGPTVQICAGIASSLGRVFRLSKTNIRRLLPVGAAAGVAAAFNAPIAAVTFTIEEIVGNLDQTVLSGVIVAAALAAVIERSLLGEQAVLQVPDTYGLAHASSLLVYAVLGVMAAAASVAFSESLLALRRKFRGMKRVPVWARPALGAFCTGVLAVLALRFVGTRGVTGGGYETLGEALAGKLEIRVMAALCLFKIAATVCSYSSGGAGGIFAPSLFIGGMLGGVVAVLDVTALGHTDSHAGAFALVGMGAAFSGIVRAPITSVLIIIEMTREYSLILPLMIANMTAYALAKSWRPRSIYEALLEQDGIELPTARAGATLEGRVIAGMFDPSAPFQSFLPAMRGPEILRTSHSSATQRVFPVLDGMGRLLGVVTPEELRLLDSEPDLAPVVTASDLMRGPISVRANDDLQAALAVMLTNGVREVPILDESGRVLGLLNDTAIADAYLRRSERTE